jgi:hypothetical protein
MSRRALLISWIAGFLAAAPVIVLGTLLSWPAISFLGAMLLFGVVFFATLDRFERGGGRHSRRPV